MFSVFCSSTYTPYPVDCKPFVLGKAGRKKRKNTGRKKEREGRTEIKGECSGRGKQEWKGNCHSG